MFVRDWLTVAAATCLFCDLAAAAPDWAATIPPRIKEALYPVVIDAGWGDVGLGLWLFVVDNGKSRDGVATAACGSLELMKDIPRGTLIVVRVFDVATTMAGQDAKQLGKATCSL